jgi:hypothetical protein
MSGKGALTFYHQGGFFGWPSGPTSASSTFRPVGVVPDYLLKDLGLIHNSGIRRAFKRFCGLGPSSGRKEAWTEITFIQLIDACSRFLEDHQAVGNDQEQQQVSLLLSLLLLIGDYLDAQEEELQLPGPFKPLLVALASGYPISLGLIDGIEGEDTKETPLMQALGAAWVRGDGEEGQWVAETLHARHLTSLLLLSPLLWRIITSCKWRSTPITIIEVAFQMQQLARLPLRADPLGDFEVEEGLADYEAEFGGRERMLQMRVAISLSQRVMRSPAPSTGNLIWVLPLASSRCSAPMVSARLSR